MVVSTKDISFVIQGPIQGKSNEPYEKRYTCKLIDSILKYYQGSEIVISTWEGEDTTDLFYDKVIYNVDPGSEIYIKEEGSLKNYRYNVNRQIISTINGLENSSRKYACKIRSDLLFLNGNLLNYVNKFENIDKRYQILEDRIILTNVTSVNPNKNYKLPYHPCDWFYFGLTKDLIRIWDIPLCEEKIDAVWFEENERPAIHPLKYSLARYQAEQYIWVTFLKKVNNLHFVHSCDLSDENIKKSEIIFAQNTCILDLKRLGLKNQKHKISKAHLYNMYTYRQWEKKYLLYSKNMNAFRLDYESTINFLAFSFAKFKGYIKKILRG